MYPRPLYHAEALGPGCAGPALADPTAPPTARAPTALAPLSGAAPFAVAPADVAADADPRQRTTTPYVTGTSVLGLIYKDGIMLASDTLGSYGSTKRYKSFQRLAPIGSTTVLGAGGELSDFQYILRLTAELDAADFCANDGETRTPAALHSYLTRVLYNRRSKFDPLWNSLVVGGVDAGSGEKFLGCIGMLGVSYTDGHVATGFGAHLARPLFREKWAPDMDAASAEALLREALAVCYYRDKQTINKFQIATVTATDGVQISDPFALETRWGYAAFANPSAHAVGTW